MKKLNLPKLTPLILLCFLLIDCAHAPPDVPVCQGLSERLYKDPVTAHLIYAPNPVCIKQTGEASCGHCTYIVSGKQVYVGSKAPYLLDKKPWLKIVAESVLVPSVESYAPLSAYIINACEQLNCSADVTRFKVQVDSVTPASGQQ